MDFVFKNRSRKPKIPDLFSCTADESQKICSFVRNYMKIIWRLSKKRDFYLFTVISNPNRIFDFNEIYSLRYLTLKKQNEFQKKIDLEDTLKDQNDTFIESVDEKTIKSVKRRIRQIKIILDTKADSLSKTKLSNYQEELDILIKYLNSSVKKSNPSKPANLYLDNHYRRKNIISAIKNSLQKIKDRDSTLYSSLINHLKFDKYLLFFIGPENDDE